MFTYLTPDEVRQTPIFAAVVAEFLTGPEPGPARPRDASGRFAKVAAHQAKAAADV